MKPYCPVAQFGCTERLALPLFAASGVALDFKR